MRIYKTPEFMKWAKKEKLSDSALKATIIDMQKGLIGANLGGQLFKKRIARLGQGKRGGFRSLIAFKRDERAIFVFGFSKSDRDNIDEYEKSIYKKLAGYYLNLNDDALASLVKRKMLFEVLT